MRNIVKNIELIAACLLFNACLEKFDIPLNSAGKPQVVIEGMVTNETPRQWVRVSLTNQNAGSNLSTPVNDASVYLSDDSGQYRQLAHSGQGLYVIDSFYGQVNHEYTLKVNYDNREYISTEKMNPAGTIDSVIVIYKKGDVLYKKGFYLNVYATKASMQTNYSRATISVNDSLYNNYENLLVIDDSYTTPNQQFTIPYAFEVHDSVEIKVFSLSENVYNYYYQLLQLTENFYNRSQLILNPPSNISGGSLGFFQVSEVKRTTVVIP